MYHKYQTAFYKEFGNKNILISKPLDFESYIDNLKIIKNYNTSIIISGTLNPICNLHSTPLNENIVVKMTFNNTEGNNGFVVERDIYEKVITPLILNKNTPNLIMYINNYKYKDYIKFLHLHKKISPIQDEILEYTELIHYEYDNNFVNLLLLEKGDISLFDLFRKLHSSNKFYIPYYTYHIFTILYQIIYTLKCFEEVGLMHHDLHAKNILIDILPSPIKIKYYDNINDSTKYKLLNIKYLVKIFDYDHSTKVLTQYNKKRIYNNMLNIEYIQHPYHNEENENNRVFDSMANLYNMGNNFKKGYDLFRLLYTFYTHPIFPSYVKEWIEKQIDISLFVKVKKNNSYGYYNLKNEDEFKEVELLHSLDDILLTQFDEYIFFSSSKDEEEVIEEENIYKLPSLKI